MRLSWEHFVQMSTEQDVRCTYEEMGRNNSISKLIQASNDVLGEVSLKPADWCRSLLARLAFAQ